MVSRIKVLVASRSAAAADAVAGKIRGDSRFDVTARAIVNGHTDPLHDVNPRPDLLLLHYLPGHGELEYLASLRPDQRVRLLVFGPAADGQAMRLAMRAGASDYLPEPLNEADLLNGLEHVCEELSQRSDNTGSLITLVNSKGGSGASFVASNLACGLAQEQSGRTALIDLDLQFGGLSRYLDLSPERGLAEALGAINEMDQVAAAAFVTPHRSGLKLLAAPVHQQFEPAQIAPEHIDALLKVFLQTNDYVIADLPRRIDAFSTAVLDQSDRILLVVQQSVAHINCAARLLHIMCSELGVRRNRIEIVVNRFTKKAVIELNDIRKTLKVDHLHVVPNQYKLVLDSIDTGEPVVESMKGSAVAKALQSLVARISGPEAIDSRRTGFLGRTLPNLLGTN